MAANTSSMTCSEYGRGMLSSISRMSALMPDVFIPWDAPAPYSASSADPSREIVVAVVGHPVVLPIELRQFEASVAILHGYAARLIRGCAIDLGVFLPFAIAIL